MPKDTFNNLIEDKQEKVMRAAISEFINHGFDNAKVSIIAKNAGVAKGSMYQYFENKKDLFLYSVQWSLKLLMKKFGNHLVDKTDQTNIFDFYFQNAKTTWSQLEEEREIVIFMQDVFLGKYSNLMDESMEYILKISDEFLLQQIREGKKSGYIRDDIDDNILCLFMTGVSIKIKTYMMNKTRSAGLDMVDGGFDIVEKDIKAMIELLKNGMHNKNDKEES